LNKKL